MLTFFLLFTYRLYLQLKIKKTCQQWTSYLKYKMIKAGKLY